MKLFFHVRAGTDFFPDTEGCEVDDLTQVHELIANVAEEFDVPTDEIWTFEVTSADGKVILVVPVSPLSSPKQN